MIFLDPEKSVSCTSHYTRDAGLGYMITTKMVPIFLADKHGSTKSWDVGALSYLRIILIETLLRKWKLTSTHIHEGKRKLGTFCLFVFCFNVSINKGWVRHSEEVSNTS